MLAVQLVTDAMYLSENDRYLQPALNGGEVSHAMDVLNLIFDEWRDLIPYSVEYQFDSVDDLLGTQFVQVDNVSFVLPGSTPQRAVYQLISRDLTRFVADRVILDLEAIPAVYYFDPLKQNIDVYPKPAQPAYSFIVWGRAQIGPLTLNSSIPDNVPKFMIKALKYQLGYELSAENGIPFNEDKMRILNTALNQLKSKREIPLSAPAFSVFGRPDSTGIPPYPFFYKLSGGP